MVKLMTNVLFMICLAVMVCAEKEDIPDEEKSIIVEVVHGILNDSSYLALNDEQQLRILIIIYNMLENHLHEHQNSGLKKREISLKKIVFL